MIRLFLSCGLVILVLFTAGLPVYAESELEIAMSKAAKSASQGDYKAAEKAYRKALSQNASHPYAALGLAAMLKAQGRLEEAHNVLETLLAQHPNFQPGYYLLGLVYESRGETAQARKAYGTYVSIAPESVPKEPQVRIKLRQWGIL